MTDKKYRVLSNIVIGLISLIYVLLVVLSAVLIYLCFKIINNPSDNSYGIVYLILLLPISVVIIIVTLVHSLKLMKEIKLINFKKEYSYYLNAYALKISLFLIGATVYIALIDGIEAIALLIGFIVVLGVFLSYFIYTNKLKKMSSKDSLKD